MNLKEHNLNVLGVDCKMLPRHKYTDGLWSAQELVASRWRGSESLTVKMRFDDTPRNGNETFAITATLRDSGIRVAGGCLHDEIAEWFPEFVPLIPWHLCSIDGPMHYEANTIYFAGDRDHWGRRAGEPASWSNVAKFGENPIHHKLSDSFAAFLKGAQANGFNLEVVRIDHDERGKPGAHQFGPKFTFGGYADKWYQCPFDTETEALEFLGALIHCRPKFEKIPTSWSEGKAREFDAARSTAIWPEATDEELSQEPDELRKALRARLPALMEKFRSAMLSCGFDYPERKPAEVPAEP